MSVERLGGLAARTLGASVQRVVLVPWDYEQDCETTTWTSGATWAQPGTRALFTAILRDSAHWAGDIPTFDVFDPYHQPYPHRSRRIPPGQSIVPMDELFDLMDLFPEDQQLRDAPEAATARLFAWARANPAAARRYPMTLALSSARYSVANHRLRSIQSPMVGTYRFSVSLNGSGRRTFYARTRPAAVSDWNYTMRLERPDDDPTLVRRPDGYSLLASVASSPEELPQRCDAGRDPMREDYMAVVDSVTSSQAVRRVWKGVLEAGLAERAFPGDTALARVAKAADEAYMRRARQGLPAQTPARFSEAADGSISVEQELRLEDGRTLVLRGTRISSDVIACPRP